MDQFTNPVMAGLIAVFPAENVMTTILRLTTVAIIPSGSYQQASRTAATSARAASAPVSETTPATANTDTTGSQTSTA